MRDRKRHRQRHERAGGDVGMSMLSDFADINAGQGAPQGEGHFNFQRKGFPFVRAGSLAFLCEGESIDNCEFIEPKIASKHKLKLYPKDSIVFAKSGMSAKIGRVYRLEKDAYIVNHLAVVQAKKTVSARFLEHYLQYYNPRQLIKDDSYPSIRLADIRDYIVSFPKDYDEQKRIAAILDQAHALRQYRRHAITRLNDLSQSIFHEMFGDPVHNERKWKFEKLGDLTTKISSGSTPKGGNKNYVDDGIIFLRSQNVWWNRLELDDVVYIDEATHKKMKKSSLKNGDILITKTGRINTENSSLGRAAMFLGEDDSANVNGHVYLVRPKPAVLKEFILYIMTTPEYREYIRSVCVGGIDKRQINKGHLEEFPIIYPPIERQKEFLDKLKAIEEQKERFNEQLKVAETLFLSLQQRAFRGEL